MDAIYGITARKMRGLTRPFLVKDSDDDQIRSIYASVITRGGLNNQVKTAQELLNNSNLV